jgi:hypothetical protein
MICYGRANLFGEFSLTAPPNPPAMRNAEEGVITATRMNASARFNTLSPFILAGLFLFFVLAFAPLSTALQFGSDEGYELMKGLLLSRGFELYSQIWSDQPPLHTALLSILFKLFGPSILAARLLTVAFAILLISSFYLVVRSQAGIAAGWAGTVLLIFSPFFMELSVSAMIVLPAMALGFFSIWCLFRHSNAASPWPLFFSGITMGLALQIKWVAALFFPALLAQLILIELRPSAVPSSGPPDKPVRSHLPHGLISFLKRLTKFLSILTAGMLLAFGLIWLWFPHATAELLWGTHFSTETRQAFSHTASFRAFHHALAADWGALAGAGLAFISIFIRRKWELLCPVVLLITVYIFHSFHRPYWYFHYLHFAIPLAWLSAIAIRELTVYVWNADWAGIVRPPFPAAIVLVVWAALVAILSAELPYKARSSWTSIRSVSKIDEYPLVQALRAHAATTDWVIVDRAIHAFHAGIPVPPPLAVVSQKRIHSGRYNADLLYETLLEYQPEFVTPQTSRSNPKIAEYLEENYEPVNESMGVNLLKKEK